MSETTSLLPKLEMPVFRGIDAEALMELQKRNLDAISSASHIVVDGACALGERQTAIMQSSMDALAKRSEAALASPKFMDFGTSVELMQQAYVRAVGSVREILDIFATTQKDAFNVVNTCMMTNIDEMKKLAD